MPTVIHLGQRSKAEEHRFSGSGSDNLENLFWKVQRVTRRMDMLS